MKAVVSLGIDINSSFIALVFSKVQGNFSKVVTYRKIDKNRKDFDLFNTESALLIEKEIKKVERQWEAKVSKVYYSLACSLVKKITGVSRNVLHPKGSVSIGQKQIRKSIEQAKLLNVDWNLHCIHSLPLGFKVDGKFFKDPPLGIYGRRLETEVIFYTCDSKTIMNIERFFQYIGKDYSQLVLSPLARLASFKEKDIDIEDFVILDFGKKGLEIASFINCVLQDIVHISFGGDWITSKLAAELDVSFELAEDLKVSYGSLLPEDTQSDKIVTTKGEFNYNEIRLGIINSVLSFCYGDLFGKIKQVLVDNNMLRKAGFLLVSGGGSKIKGLKQSLEKDISIPVKEPDSYIEAGIKDKDDFLAAFGSLRFSSCGFNFEKKYSLPQNLLKRMANIWEEYF